MKEFIDTKSLPRLYIDQDAGKPPMMVHVDCGHGGLLQGLYTTKGKQWDFEDFQIFEGVENRKTGKRLAEQFYNNHISYCFTTISNADESLTTRMEYMDHVVKQYPKYKHVLLSIHHDATESESDANGVSFYTSPNITDSDFAANLYFPYLFDMGLRVRVNRAKPQEYDKESNFFVLRKAEAMGAMAMLFEFGFFTNREEALKIMTDEFHQTCANALYKGTRDLITKLQKDGSPR